ncbi:hypothetical protein KR044_008479 [Drosophila immigrans]|nr:hypothetical protein KR044_008479 [Drosophila immigrans]
MTTSDELGSFCHDHIQHPLMWCDEKRRLVERKNAEESLRMWRRRKAEECARKEKDKQEYYDMFLQHCPWGRPGGGAPNVEVRRKDITAIGLHSIPTVPCRYNDYFTNAKKCHKNPLSVYHHAGPFASGVGDGGPRSSTVTICEREQPYKAGVHVAQKVNGESIHIELKEHPSMSFRNKEHVDIELRYKPSSPCKTQVMLNKIVVNSENEHQKGKLANQKKQLQAKLEKPPYKEPWGKAGPGGKPWRSPKEVGNTFMKSLGWTNKEMLKELDQDNPVTPAEKNTFRKSRGCKPPKPLHCCKLCTCSCPSLTSTSPIKQYRKICIATEQPACASRSTPKECKSIKTCTLHRGHCTGNNTNCTITPVAGTANNGEGGGGVELVPLLARRRGLHRPISLSSTDVTKRTPSHDRYAPHKHKTISMSSKEQNINNIISKISQMKKRLPKNLNCKFQCCSCDCVTATAVPPTCCLKRLTLHIR